MLRAVALLFCLLASFIECRAQKNIPQQQDTTIYWRVVTKDDNEFIGVIKGTENGSLILETEKLGTIRIRQVDIAVMDQVDSKTVSSDGIHLFDNFQTTHYFWMQNGYGLKKGEGYYQNVWILLNQFSVGITDHFSITAGTVPIFLFGSSEVPLWIQPKLSIPISEKIHLGVSALYVTVLPFNNNFNLGVGFGTLTVGSPSRNLSLGLGYGFSNGDIAKRPVITLAGMFRTGPRSYLMTENYIFGFGNNSDAAGLLSVGGRQIIKRLGLDYGGFIPVAPGIGRLIIIPWLGFSLPLTKRHH